MAYMTSIPSGELFLVSRYDRSVNPLSFTKKRNKFICIDIGDGFGLKLARSIQYESETGLTDT
jgi:hypothetical protein